MSDCCGYKRCHCVIVLLSIVIAVSAGSDIGLESSCVKDGRISYTYDSVTIRDASIIDVLDYMTGISPDSSSRGANPVRGLVVSASVLPVLESTSISLSTNGIEFSEFRDLIEKSTDDLTIVEKDYIVYATKKETLSQDDIVSMMQEKGWADASAIRFYNWRIRPGTPVEDALNRLRDRSLFLYKALYEAALPPEISTSSNLMVRKTGLVSLGNTNLKEILVALAVSCDLTLNVQSSKVTFVEITPTPLPTENKKE